MQETQETWVRSLGWEDPLEEEMVTHSSIFAWKIPWTEEPRGLQSMELQRVRHDWSDWARMLPPDTCVQQNAAEFPEFLCLVVEVLGWLYGIYTALT